MTTAGTTVKGAALPGWYRRHEPLLLPLLTFGVVLVAWEAGAATGILNPRFFSSPGRVAATGALEVAQAEFWYDVGVSTLSFTIGYVIALVAGVAFGLVAGWYRRVSYLVDPWLNAFNAMPRLALLPLIVLWVGLGLTSKIVVVALGVFFPVAVNTFHGVRTVDPALLRVATAFRASQLRIFTTVVVPATVPFILAGARLGVGRGVAGVVVGEFYSAEAGLAHRVFQAGRAFQTDRLLFGALMITVLALLAFRAIAALERRWTRGRPVGWGWR